MARKDLLANLIAKGGAPLDGQAPEIKGFSDKQQLTYKTIGALGAVTRSIDALAAKADIAKIMERKLAEGTTVVDLDPETIESSFVRDRVVGEDQEFLDLLEAIRIRGQDSPILVRPHPEKPGFYQIAFGHRRARAARLLGRPVRAVVRELDDRDHVIAQGQENSARADLSFIERALFAARLEQLGFDRETIMLALNADKTTVSKMLSVTKRIPPKLIDMLEAARSVGRDRWHELSARCEDTTFRAEAVQLASREDFVEAMPESRFERIERLYRKTEAKKTAGHEQMSHWQQRDGAVKALIKETSSRFTIALEARKAKAFGAYLTQNLDRLFETFEQEQSQQNNGD